MSNHMFYTTLNRIRENNPCCDGWEKLLKSLGKTKADDEPLSLLEILNSNGLSDAVWALRCIDDCPEIRLFTVRCVRQVQHLCKDPRSLEALDVAERFAIGEATEAELREVYAASKATWDAARGTVWTVAKVAAWEAAREARKEAAWAATREERDESRYAARAEVWDSAWDAARAAQEADFRAIFCSE